jgi:hypothetical protein
MMSRIGREASTSGNTREIEADVLLQINTAATFGAQSPHVANMPTAAAAMTAVASQPRLLSHGLSVN